MIMELLAKLQHKKEAYRRWKQGQINLEKYRNTVQTSKEGIRKAKAQTDFNAARMSKTRRVSTYNKYI